MSACILEEHDLIIDHPDNITNIVTIMTLVLPST